MPTAVLWSRVSSGDHAAVSGPYKLFASNYRDRDGWWWKVLYGTETYASGQAMSLENAQALAENSIR